MTLSSGMGQGPRHLDVPGRPTGLRSVPRALAMLLVLCRDPLEPSRPDRAFETEVAAIERLGLPHVLVDHDALVGGEPERAVQRVPEPGHFVLAAYRGWMVTAGQYRWLYESLFGRGVVLINDPGQYRHCHHLPESYPAIEGLTPRTVWLAGDLGIDRIMEALAPLGDAPIVLKDFVKSRKHEWLEACFIPSASDRRAVERVVGRFLELQEEDLTGGLVFREFVEFEPIGVHPGSGMPITEEYRIFWLDGEPVSWSPYWEGSGYGGEGPPINDFEAVAAAVRSRFFTMDVARRRDGGWMVVELGDGQVSGLPGGADPHRFYAALAEHWPDRPRAR